MPKNIINTLKIALIYFHIMHVYPSLVVTAPKMNMSLHWPTKVGDARYKSQKVNWTELDNAYDDDDHDDDDEEDEDQAKLSTLGWSGIWAKARRFSGEQFY